MDVASKGSNPMGERRVEGMESNGRLNNGLEDDSSILIDGAHRIEEDVQRELLGETGLQFSSLVVRRVPGGVCLEGVLEADDVDGASSSIDGFARRVAGVQEVLNHLVVHQASDNLPAKG
jgi:osmotically-inducible protein OsmY